MRKKPLLSLMVFGSGHGESILLIIDPKGKLPRALVIDCYATKPYDSPKTNPIIGVQPGRFDWNEIKVICLTHAHDDHFLGLAPVAKLTTNAIWAWPGAMPIDAIVDYYQKFADYKGPVPSAKTWFAKSIKDLGDWGKSQEFIQVISGRSLDWESITITFIAPKDEKAQEYNRRIIENWSSNLLKMGKAPPDDFHNIPSAGIVIDTKTKKGNRIVLLGDMVEESWAPIFKDRALVDFLKKRKADIIKLPHHCSKYAVWKNLLELIADPKKTTAIFTPYRLEAPPPHRDAVRLASQYVADIWCTVPLSGGNERWHVSDFEIDQLQISFFENPKTQNLPVLDCSVSFEIAFSGKVSCTPGRYACRCSV